MDFARHGEGTEQLRAEVITCKQPGEQNVLVIPDGNLTVKRGPIHLKVLQILEEDGTESRFSGNRSGNAENVRSFVF